MPNNIYIVHRSEVIRKGFEVMLRSFDSRNVIACASVDEFFDDHANATEKSLIMVEAKVVNRFKNYKVLVIDAINPVSKNILQVSIHTSTLELQEKITGFEQKTESGDKTEDYNALTERETDVLRLVAYGYSNKDIADKLFISIHTVISHRKNITEKLSIKSISGLTVYAMLNNLIDSDNIDLSELI